MVLNVHIFAYVVMMFSACYGHCDSGTACVPSKSIAVIVIIYSVDGSGHCEVDHRFLSNADI
jgi:hypothetical protein